MNLNDYRDLVHSENSKWWYHPQTGEQLERNKGELIALIHSEVSELMEGERKDLMDTKLTHRKMAEVELVDAIIRLLDYAGGFGYDVENTFREKVEFNSKQEDHKTEALAIANGKVW